MPEFFYRFEGLDLIPGNKTSGFAVLIATDTLMRLRSIRVPLEQQQALHRQMQERLERAKLCAKRQLRECTFNLFEQSACPWFFTTGPAFGGSVGGNPDELGWLTKPDAIEWIGPVMAFTPHNVDTPAQALILMLMVQTWAEWVPLWLRPGPDVVSPKPVS